MSLWTEKTVERIRAYLSGARNGVSLDSFEILVRLRKSFEVSVDLNKKMSSDQRKLEFVGLRVIGQGKMATVFTQSMENEDL